VNFLRREGVTLWHATAAQLAAAAAADVVAPADLPALRNVSWWAVGMSASVVSYWTRRVGHARFTSLYGAPEAATVTTHQAWRAGAEPESDVPLGAACPGQEIVILDAHEEPAAADTVGDIWIRGVGLSPGYWGNAGATSEAFRSDGPGRDRMWRTGDRGRRAPDGSVYLVGAVPAEVWRAGAVSRPAAAALGSSAGA
jgi:non-ribosomal peptide synthetase component F